MVFTDAQWDALLVWLGQHGMDLGDDGLLVERRERPGAGHGLFARRYCAPSTNLFTIPASALLNSKTLSTHYPESKTLSATCLISLHLLLHRPIDDGDSDDPLFGPYISILPRNFDSHPLTWRVRREFSEMMGECPLQEELLRSLPPKVGTALDELWMRFIKDWRSTCRYVKTNCVHVHARLLPRNLALTRFGEEDAELTMDFTWAWLIVNTRCISYRLKAPISDPDNLTLCPILDFANHVPDPSTSMQPLQVTRDIWSAPPELGKGKDFTLRTSATLVTNAGDELYLTYGAHSNTTLFLEYGFVNPFTPHEISDGRFAGELDIEDAVTELFQSGEREKGEWLRSVLEEEGYWGDWTLHTAPSPAHPSFRLITALRLYSFVQNISIQSLHVQPSGAILKSWKDVHLGLREYISQENEVSWRETLLSICTDVKNETLKHLETRCSLAKLGSWECWMEENIDLLWSERRYVAEAVIRSLQSGCEF